MGLGARRQSKTHTYFQGQLVCFELWRKSTHPIHARQTGHQPPTATMGKPSHSGQLKQGVSLLVRGLFCHGTILRCLHGSIHLHRPWPRRQQGWAFLDLLHHWPPQNPSPSLFKLDGRGRRSHLQLLPHCHIPPMPEVLLLRQRHLPWHWQQPQRGIFRTL